MSSESSRDDEPRQAASSKRPPKTSHPSLQSNNIGFLDVSSTSNPSVDRLQLPSYILKNLTPVSHRRSSRTPSKSKVSAIEERKQRLLQRSQTISRKLAQLKKERSSLMQQRMSSMNYNYECAARRRAEYLNKVKASARKFISPTVPTLKCEPLAPPHPYSSEPSDTPYTKLAHNRAERLQKLLNSDSFYDKVFKVSYRRAIYMLGTKECYFSEYLAYMDIPSYSRAHTGKPFRPFLYAFLLVNEFASCLGDGLGHPGFNSNADQDEVERFFQNFICLLLYKTAQRLINEFRLMLITSNKIAFCKSWKQYCFLFHIFKRFHLRNVNIILNQAIGLVDKQSELFVDDASIRQHKENLVNEKLLLDSYRKTQDFNGETSQFIEALRSIVKNLHAERGKKTSESIFNGDQTIIYRGFMIRIPNLTNFSTSKWRRFWIEYYRNQDASVNSINLRTGRTNPKLVYPDRNLKLNMDDVLRHLGEPPLSSKYELCDEFTDQSILYLVGFLKDIIADMLAFIHNFSSTHKTATTTIHIVEGDCGSKELLRGYFDWISRTISSENVINLHQIPENCCKILEQNTCLGIDSFRAIVQETMKLEHVIYRRWFERCQFQDFQHFQRFERIYVLINTPNFQKVRPSIFTYSPCLLFPSFYQWLSRLGTYGFTSLSRCDPIARASLGHPNVLVQESREDTFAFFKHLFIDLIIHGSDRDFERNELNELFTDKFNGLHNRLKRIIRYNSSAILTTNYFNNFRRKSIRPLDQKGLRDALEADNGEVGTATCKYLEEDMRHDNDFIHLESFEKYHLGHQERIESLMRNKLVRLFHEYRTESYYSIMSGNFHHYARELDETVSNALRDIVYVYQVYQPLFDWIHMDLGRPAPSG